MLILAITTSGRLYAYRSFKALKRACHPADTYIMVFDGGVLIDEGEISVFINL